MLPVDPMADRPEATLPSLGGRCLGLGISDRDPLRLLVRLAMSDQNLHTSCRSGVKEATNRLTQTARSVQYAIPSWTHALLCSFNPGHRNSVHRVQTSSHVSHTAPARRMKGMPESVAHPSRPRGHPFTLDSSEHRVQRVALVLYTTQRSTTSVPSSSASVCSRAVKLI